MKQTKIACSTCHNPLLHDPQNRRYVCPTCNTSLSELRMIVTGQLKISANEKLEETALKGYAI